LICFDLWCLDGEGSSKGANNKWNIPVNYYCFMYRKGRLKNRVKRGVSSGISLIPTITHHAHTRSTQSKRSKIQHPKSNNSQHRPPLITSHQQPTRKATDNRSKQKGSPPGSKWNDGIAVVEEKMLNIRWWDDGVLFVPIDKPSLSSDYVLQ
jgi:hypothetical protein